MKRIIITAAALAIAAPAAAQVRHSTADPAVLETTVSYSDLDLGRPAGAAAMLTRIRNAAGMVCGEAPRPNELKRVQRRRACLAQTMDAVVRQVNAPLVTALYLKVDPPAQLAVK
jgi:UrcA family protein